MSAELTTHAMNQTDASGLQLRSRVASNGDLELSLASVPTPAPAANEILLRIEAAPTKPSNLGLLLAAADPAQIKQSGTRNDPVVTGRVPDALLKGLRGRFDISMPACNEGAGVVVEAGR